ncbi:HAMP domain-containing sensor histidine kinase [Solwaraspora sp. WMMA2056]|uniref:HAMP domain-containing sensor histidine kinase n=1 Tax=Solwaraspora sp. WMMA2056 TaxID=3015161 RepID=UPI00259B4941|nr:HAMP domain-containing sensor histidine kinase [Solwaraspora sp. WMMA2056]WJK39477.1 HAMP domain-containing sensor histidine kinase [Solwaraspora sp. WMMA2056]
MAEAGTATVPPVRHRITGTLTARTVGVACAVALLSVLVTAAVAIPLGVRGTERGARASLAARADLVAAAVSGASDDAQRAALLDRLAGELAGQGIELVGIAPGSVPRQLPDSVLRRLAAGEPVAARRPARIDGRPTLVEGRPTGGQTAVVLLQPLRPGAGRLVWSNLWLALVAGLGAGLVAGVLLAARLSRPIRAAAHAAQRLRTGDRTVRVPVEPPVEAAQLAHALNDLAAALAASEARQRDFLLSISHELRTPLTTLRGYAEALADGVVDADATGPTGRIMLDEAHRLDRLVGDLLALARLEAADFTIEVADVDLGTLLADAVTAWSPRFAGSGVTVALAVPPAPLPVRTDPGRLRQVVDILLDNALRVVPAGGTVRVGVPSDPPATEPDTVAVQVHDDGPGFTDDDLAVIFERGALHRRYRGERSVGTGIGLALAAGLTQRIGGRITAGHSPGGGAVFTVLLPRRPGGPVAPGGLT